MTPRCGVLPDPASPPGDAVPTVADHRFGRMHERRFGEPRTTERHRTAVSNGVVPEIIGETESDVRTEKARSHRRTPPG